MIQDNRKLTHQEALSFAELLVEFAEKHGLTRDQMSQIFEAFPDAYYYDKDDPEEAYDLLKLIEDTLRSGDATMLNIIRTYVSQCFPRKRPTSVGAYMSLIRELQVEYEEEFYYLVHELISESKNSSNPKIERIFMGWSVD